MAVTGCRLLHLSDLHLGAEEGAPGPAPDLVLARVLAEIVDRRLRIDGCIVTGDLVHAGQARHYDRLRRLLNSCPWPTRVVPGNHDDPATGREILGPDYWPSDDPWAWECEGCTVIGTDSMRPGFHHGELGEPALAGLERLAAAAAARGPWVLALHHPPLDVGHWWMDGEGLLVGRDRVLEIAREHGAAAILCGHVHVQSVVHIRGGPPVVVAPSVAHEVMYDDLAERPLRFRAAPPRALVHHVAPGCVATSTVTFGGPSWLVEGMPWKDEVMRTNRRMPAEHQPWEISRREPPGGGPSSP